MSNKRNSHIAINPDVIEECINDISKLKKLIYDLQGCYEAKCDELKQLEKCHIGLLKENADLKGCNRNLKAELKQARKSKDKQNNDDLVHRITDVCQNVINDHDWEQKLAYDALLMYHNGVNKALLFGVSEVMDSGGASNVYLSIKEQLANTCEDVAATINIGTTTAFGYSVAKKIKKDSTNNQEKEQKEEDHDETMGQT